MRPVGIGYPVGYSISFRSLAENHGTEIRRDRDLIVSLKIVDLQVKQRSRDYERKLRRLYQENAIFEAIDLNYDLKRSGKRNESLQA